MKSKRKKTNLFKKSKMKKIRQYIVQYLITWKEIVFLYTEELMLVNCGVGEDS